MGKTLGPTARYLESFWLDGVAILKMRASDRTSGQCFRALTAAS